MGPSRARLLLEDARTEGQAVRCRWLLERGDRPPTFESPLMFGSFSVSGNQWLKLLYFYNDWSPWLNLLVSQADIYRCRPYLRDEIASLGLREHIISRARKLRRALNGTEYSGAHREYASREGLNGKALGGLTMLDSGGFTFGNPRNLTLIRSQSNFSPGILATVEALNKEQHFEHSDSWTERRARDMARSAQVPHLRFGLSVRPDFLVTLDRIIENPRLPIYVKRRRAYFSISCAGVALSEVSRLARCDSILLPVVHPYGPAAPEVLEQYSKGEIIKAYASSMRWQIRLLEAAEQKAGEDFGGLAIGSLVPFDNSTMAPLLASAMERCLRESSFMGRFIHCFGASNEKMEILRRHGVQSFDTNHHVKFARARRFYSPSSKTYVNIREHRIPRCTCVICRRHSRRQFRENRQGLKEVSTVLIALHNFRSNHVERLRSGEDLTEANGV